MSVDLSQLEQAWLAAETIADEARQQALELSEELAKRTGGAATEGPEVSLLASRVARRSLPRHAFAPHSQRTFAPGRDARGSSRRPHSVSIMVVRSAGGSSPTRA